MGSAKRIHLSLSSAVRIHDLLVFHTLVPAAGLSDPDQAIPSLFGKPLHCHIGVIMIESQLLFHSGGRHELCSRLVYPALLFPFRE